MTRFIHRDFSLILLVAALAGCGGAQAGNNAQTMNKADAGGGANALAAANQAEAANAAAPDAAPGPEVMLTRTGLAVGTRGLHPGLTYEFGRPQAEIVAMATEIRGRPTGSGRNEECGEGPVDFVDFGNLRVNFQNGRFVGWDTSPGAAPVRDEWGLGIGSPRSELEDENDPPLRVENSTLGVEFSSGGMGGLLSSTRPDATVTDLWAGLICAFR